MPEPQTGAGVEEQAEPVMTGVEGLLAEAVPLAGLVGLETVKPEAAREVVGDAGWNHEERKQSDSGSRISSASEFEGCKTATGVQKAAWIKSGAGKGVLSEAGKVAGKGAEAGTEDGTGVEIGSGKGAWAGAGGFPPLKDEVVSGMERLQEVSAALKATEREEEKGRNRGKWVKIQHSEVAEHQNAIGAANILQIPNSQLSTYEKKDFSKLFIKKEAVFLPLLFHSQFILEEILCHEGKISRVEYETFMKNTFDVSKFSFHMLF